MQSGLQVIADNTTVNTPIQLLADQSISENTGTLTIGGAIDLNGHTLTLDDEGTAQTTLQQTISGTGSLVTTGSGTAVLNTADSFTGTTTINAGTLTIEDAGALGTTDGTAATGTTVNNGATLELDGSFTVANDLLTSNGGTLQSDGNESWSGTINNSSSLTFATASGQSLLVSGNVTGDGGITVVGGGADVERQRYAGRAASLCADRERDQHGEWEH